MRPPTQSPAPQTVSIHPAHQARGICVSRRDRERRTRNGGGHDAKEEATDEAQGVLCAVVGQVGREVVERKNDGVEKDSTAQPQPVGVVLGILGVLGVLGGFGVLGVLGVLGIRWRIGAEGGEDRRGVGERGARCETAEEELFKEADGEVVVDVIEHDGVPGSGKPVAVDDDGPHPSNNAELNKLGDGKDDKDTKKSCEDALVFEANIGWTEVAPVEDRSENGNPVPGTDDEEAVGPLVVQLNKGTLD
ncbi:hypothetical protein BC936DRAFT_142221 [Jimgerdemannia flammicorona]|uniref:Uncharacterized protein n=1 Tax=Jimgerdemannia flammicorona TaxID=994334 RepID=A0A433A0R4_9FUNG|nr:hypothetical protein BC936DRAFT_142221 [Jimgerdemannia flammicorona]